MNTSKKRRELTAKDRYLIEKCLKAKQSKASIAKLLNVSIKTIVREIQRGTVELKDTELRLYKTYSSHYAKNAMRKACANEVVNLFIPFMGI